MYTYVFINTTVPWIRDLELGGTDLVRELWKDSLKKWWPSWDMRDELTLIGRRGEGMLQVEGTESAKALWPEEASVRQTVFSNDDCITMDSSAYHVTLKLIHREWGSMFPPLECWWACDYSRGDAIWLLRLYLKTSHRVALGPSHHVVRQPHNHMASPSWRSSWQRVSPSRHMSDETSDDSSAYDAEWSRDELPPTRLSQTTMCDHNKYCPCLKPLSIGMVCSVAHGELWGGQ